MLRGGRVDAYAWGPQQPPPPPPSLVFRGTLRSASLGEGQIEFGCEFEIDLECKFYRRVGVSEDDGVIECVLLWGFIQIVDVVGNRPVNSLVLRFMIHLLKEAAPVSPQD